MGTSCRLVLACCVAACGGSSSEASWAVVHEDQPAALLSVWGTSADDVWAVGGDANDGDGPLVLHYDGAAWARLRTGIGSNASPSTGPIDLWWVFGVPDGPVFLSGSKGTILRYQNGAFEHQPTPLASPIVFGMWGASANDVWAVGGNNGGQSGGLLWHFDGTSWTADPSVPADDPITTGGVIWKINGLSASDIWMTGTNGFTAHWNGSALERTHIITEASLFSVGIRATASGTLAFATGTGNGGGEIYENDGGGWAQVTPANTPELSGVAVTDSDAIAVGFAGSVLQRGASAWSAVDTRLTVFEDLHAAWIDPTGDVWAVGGQFNSSPTTKGVLIHRGSEIPGGIQ